MLADSVHLNFVPGGGRAHLREICGACEEAVHGTDAVTAILLLDRLLMDGPEGSIGPGKSASLPTADRDRMLTAVYVHTYGPRVESTVTCRHCSEPFDLDFSLIELLDDLQKTTPLTAIGREADGTFKLPSGQRFRLPTGEDEYAVMHLRPDEAERALMARCLISEDENTPPEDIQAAMQAVAPLLDLEMDALCPECGETQAIHFDIQSYLLSALLSERSRLAREVHCLATAYGWSPAEILGLPRSRRRMYVALVEAEANRLERQYE